MKKITILVMTVSLLLSVAVTAYAKENPDRDREGSLTLIMEWRGEQLNSGTLTVCQVGQIVYEGNGWNFALIPQLQESGLSLKNLDDAQLAKQLAQQVKEQKIPGMTAPIQKGKAVFKNLAVGLYLVTQEKACKGFSPINPFLVSLPRWENDSYRYDLTARPKVSLEPLPTLPPETEEPTSVETEPPRSEDFHLPQTGQLNWPVPMLVIGGLVLFLFGWFLYHDDHKKKT